ncbi:MAG: phage holin family protein [bacterium]|nr:phage holin family protein [bacterium]
MLTSLIASLIGNAAGLLLAAYYIPGFRLDFDWTAIATIAVLLMLGNAVLRPILKFIFSFVVIITLGLFTIVINAAILASIDFFSLHLMIMSIPALIYGTLIISITSFILGGAIRMFARTSPNEDA